MSNRTKMRPGAALGLAVVVGLLPWPTARAQDQDQNQGRIIEKQAEDVHKVPPADPSPAYRVPDASQVIAPPGYRVEVFASRLDFPVDITFGDDGTPYIAEAGHHPFGTEPTSAPPPKIVTIRPDGTRITVFERTLSVEQVRKADSTADMPEGIIPPITGLTWHDGKLYIAHRGRISRLDLADDNPETRFKTIVNGLPEWGEFLGGKPIFDRDGKLVFHVAAQGNAGVVDEHWAAQILLHNKLNAHEVPGEDVTLTGENFHVPLLMSKHTGMYIRVPDELHTVEIQQRTAKVPYEHEHQLEPPPGDAKTGAFVPLWTKTEAGQVVKGEKICNGAFFRCDPDGSNLERIAWGFRSCFGYRYGLDGRLITTQNGANPIAPRTLWFDQDTIYEVVDGEWYGWPDYFSGLPITDGRFAHGGESPRFVLTDETHQKLLQGRDRPRQPLVRLTPHAAAQGMVFGRSAFGVDPGDVLVAEMGTIVPVFKGGQLMWPAEAREERALIADHAPRSAPADADFDWPGFRVQVVDLETGAARDFLVNETRGPSTAARGGGLERPVQLEWGPDGALYVVDFGIISALQREEMTSMNAHRSTGVIWRIRRQPEVPSGPGR